MNAPLLRPGDVLQGRYVLADVLGEGASGRVFRARDRLRDREVAVKIVADEYTARAEAAVAAEVGHPRLVRALEAGRCPAGAYFVLELARGVPLDASVVSGADNVAMLADQLLEALAFLHANGIVHGDVKPTNVCIDQVGGRISARLLDLGFAGVDACGGTLAYAAPEVFSGGARSAMTDLYSLGVVLYELLACALPFGDPRASDYGVHALAGVVDPLPASVPPALAAFVSRLLSREPAARPRDGADARAALHDACTLASDPAQVASIMPRCVGAETLRATLFETAVAGRTSVARAVVRGPEGSGRSRLIERAAFEAGLEAHVIRAAPDGRRFGVVRQILERAAALPTGAATRDASIALETASRCEEPIMRALLEAAGALATQSLLFPLFIAVDDTDELDDLERDSLSFLVRGDGGHIAWVLSDKHAGIASAPAVAIEIAPLEAHDVAKLVASTLPGLVELERVAKAAARACRGLPSRVLAGLVALEQKRALRFAGGRYRITDDSAVDDAFTPIDASRAPLLGDADPKVLGALGLLGIAVPTALVAAATGLSLDDAARALDAALRAGVAVREGSFSRAASARVASALVLAVEPCELARIRERAQLALDGDTFELKAADCAAARFALAISGGDEARAAVLALTMARAVSGAPRVRAAWLLRARELGDVSADTALEHGDALACIGETESALVAYAEAQRAGASAARCGLARGRTLARCTRYREAAAALEGIDADVEARFYRAWSLLHLGRTVEADELAIPRGNEGRKGLALLARVRGTILCQRGDAAAGRELLGSALADAEALGDASLAADLAMTLGGALRHTGDLDGAVAQYRRALAHVRAAGDAPMTARCLNNVAITAYQAGRWAEAQEHWELFADLATRLDDRAERVLASNNLGILYKDRGETARSRAAFEKAADLAASFGLVRYEAMARGNLVDAELADGDTERAAASLERAERLAHEIDADDELAECARRHASLAFARGAFASALLLSKKAATLSASLGVKLEAGHALLVGVAAARALGDRATALAVLEEARHVFASSGTRLEQARVDLAEAELLAEAGDGPRARAKAQLALRVFEDLGATTDLGRAQAVAHGALGRGADLAVELTAALSGAETARDMLDRVLESLLVVTGAERAFVVLLEGDGGPNVAAQRTRAGVTETPPRLSAGIAERVISSKRPVVVTDVGDTDFAGRASVMKIGLRAALAAPLLRGDKAFGLLYIDSRSNPADLARWGLAPLEVACAVVAAPLDLLLARERERGRTAVLQRTAERLIESVSVIDAALELASDEDDKARRTELASSARRKCAELLAGAERVLELLRDDVPNDALPEGVDIAALARYALQGACSEGSANVEIRVPSDFPRVRADAVSLARVLTHVLELATAGASPVVMEASVVDDDVRGSVLGWRPKERSTKRVHFRISRVADACWADADELSLGPARRTLSAWRGSLFAEPGGRALIVDLEPADGAKVEVAA